MDKTRRGTTLVQARKGMTRQMGIAIIVLDNKEDSRWSEAKLTIGRKYRTDTFRVDGGSKDE